MSKAFQLYMVLMVFNLYLYTAKPPMPMAWLAALGAIAVTASIFIEGRK